MTFKYNSSKEGNIQIYNLSGELIDRNEAAELLNEIDEAIKINKTRVVLNLSELKYLNSSGLGVFLNILTRTRKSGGDVAICSLNKKITELLVITKLNSVFNVRENTDDAIALLLKKCD